MTGDRIEWSRPQHEGAQGDQWQKIEEALRQAMGPETGKSKAPKRERVVLAERRSSRRVTRTLADVEEQTGVGELLLRQLMRTQLSLAIRLMLLTVLLLGGILLALLLVPSLNAVSLGGLRLPWLLLGFAVYPVFLVVAWFYNRHAERNELEFTEMVES